MRLYHGTSSKHLNAILRDGMLPRGTTGVEGNWKGGWRSKVDFVYLSTAYLGYYASSAVSEGEDMVLLEVDGSQLGTLFPDDEFVARINSDPNIDGALEDALQRIDPAKFQLLWRASLDHNGTVCCRSVPPAAIVGYRILPADSMLWSWMGGDGLPSPVNFAACGQEYIEIIEAFMGGGVEAASELVRRQQKELEKMFAESNIDIGSND